MFKLAYILTLLSPFSRAEILENPSPGDLDILVPIPDPLPTTPFPMRKQRESSNKPSQGLITCQLHKTATPASVTTPGTDTPKQSQLTQIAGLFGQQHQEDDQPPPEVYQRHRVRVKLQGPLKWRADMAGHFYRQVYDDSGMCLSDLDKYGFTANDRGVSP